MIASEQLERARAVRLLDVISQRGIKLRGRNGSLEGPCPICGGTDRFAVTVNTKKQAFICRGCGIKGGDAIALVMALDGCDFHAAVSSLAGSTANGHAAPQPKKTYFDYPGPDGALLYQVEREDLPDGSKKIRQRRPDGKGGWVWNLGGVNPVPYRLPELLEALADGRTIVIAEGEAKADLLWSWNVPATCNSGGAGKWRAQHSAYLSGADVVILPDNDEPGRRHAEIVAASLMEAGATVRVLDLPGLPEKGDLIDWAAAGGTREQLDVLIENTARPWAAEARPNGEDPRDNGPETRAPKKPKMVAEWFDEAADSALSDPVNALIEDLLDEGALSVIYGDSGSGKTFAALDTAFHVSAGLSWNGKKVKRGLVVYVAAEGGRRIKRRIAALKKRYHEGYGDDAPEPLFALVRYQIDLRSRARYYAKIAEPQDDEDLEKAAARKRQAWHRTVKAALDAKGLMAAERDGERVLWKP
jgi:AAA domain/CHC2 zinc finger